MKKSMKYVATLAAAAVAAASLAPAVSVKADGAWQRDSNGWWYSYADGSYAASEWVNGYWVDAAGYNTYSPVGSWKADEKGWWYEDTAGYYPVSTWQKINGSDYYFNAGGYMDYNEYRDGWWLGASGAWDATTSYAAWQHNEKGWWYQSASGWYPVNQWLWINGSDYYFDANGYMAANQYVQGSWVDASGAWDPASTPAQWYRNDNGYYYEAASGWYPVSQWLTIDGVNYYFDANGYLKEYTAITPASDGRATVTVDVAANKGQEGKDIAKVLSALTKDGQSSKVKIDGKEYTVSNKGGNLYVGDTLLENKVANTKKTSAKVEVTVTADISAALKAVELGRSFGANGSYDYTVKVGSSNLSNFRISADGVSFRADGRNYTGDVKDGVLYVDGDVRNAAFVNQLGANGLISLTNPNLVYEK